jgi:hypothetical protein
MAEDMAMIMGVAIVDMAATEGIVVAEAIAAGMTETAAVHIIAEIQDIGIMIEL